MGCGCTEPTETPDFFIPYLGGVTANIVAILSVVLIIALIVLCRYLCTRPADSCVGKYLFFWARAERGEEAIVRTNEPELECLFPDPPPGYVYVPPPL